MSKHRNLKEAYDLVDFRLGEFEDGSESVSDDGVFGLISLGSILELFRLRSGVLLASDFRG